MQRRPHGAKYGKNKSRVLGHNLWVTESKPAAAATTKTQFPISPESPSNEFSSIQRNEPAVPVVPTSPSPSPLSRLAHVTSHSRNSFSLSSSSASESPLKANLRADASTTFEVMSSEDEHERHATGPSKRRKITQTIRQKKSVLAEDAKIPTIPALSTNAKMLAKKQENIPITTSAIEPNTKPVKRIPRPRKQEPVKPTAPEHVQLESANASPKYTKIVSKTKLKKTTYSRREDQAAPADNLQQEDYDMMMKDGKDRANPVRRTRAFVKTKTEDALTPRKQRNLTDDEASVASPGSIGMSDLRLTPERTPRTRYSPSPPPSTGPSPLRLGRRRRIDMLDAPKEPTSKPSTRASSADRNVSRSRSRAIGEAEQSLHQLTGLPSLTRSDSSSRQAYGRARNTYGKERSHLANMVDDLDIIGNNSSREASQTLASQLATASASSQLQMSLDLDDSPDEVSGSGSKLKSIHELRQAGLNDRFERDLEGLLGDIDPTTRKASKPLRLSACMRLFLKLSQDVFTSFVSDQALERLVGWSELIRDHPSRLLLDMILWRLVHSKNATPSKLRQIVQAVAVSTRSMTSVQHMALIIKDRRENLSRQVIRDLQAFEQKVLLDQLLPAYEGEAIVPAAITLATLNDCLRKLLDTGVRNISIGEQSFRAIMFSIIAFYANPSASDIVQNKFTLKVAFSLLQSFSTLEDGPSFLTNEDFSTIGQVLNGILNQALDRHEDLVISVLHFTISLCNERSDACRAICASPFSDGVMQIVESRFSNLINAVEAIAPLESAKLDSTILGLACLLNLTELEMHVRRDFARRRPAEDSNLSTLVNIYVRVAPRLANVTTAEESSLLVPFGHLSLLICNLCLDTALWMEASELLDVYSMSDVVASAKEMLIYLQAIETGQAQVDGSIIEFEDGSTNVDGFTQRFSAILSEVKVV